MPQPMGSNFVWHGKELSKKVDDAAMQALKKLGFAMEGDIKRSMKPGTGKEYRRGFRTPKSGGRRVWTGNKLHRASAPGEPPAVDTGRLRASVSTNWSGSGMTSGKVESKAQAGDGVSQPSKARTVRVGSAVEYSASLERGTPRMKARPHIRPVYQEYKSGKGERFFHNVLGKGTTKGAII